ncbi:non-hydrolyzing UDP-N-acetylglucosamine 2-epimerase [Conexibacter sp. CPCC 206217]|uniref:non-hydrolyzing UDP-N-acetylglucosamine 2-epimerase n=1 Tax=Conexibacter sp. CPCC 206217 TaxID=3064574 RepID=UPI002718AF1A|nr:UDP-N-acetylglucosamine 2-epimerase (non-hydrolyzing) [Conexibacter sp. CPCC 206217]MDO8212931.1 UDP-N-acetylglucosamine 2-epimerase (non-hydrolyzing) [Conexibacter sp. CPCC 206217]
MSSDSPTVNGDDPSATRLTEVADATQEHQPSSSVPELVEPPHPGAGHEIYPAPHEPPLRTELAIPIVIGTRPEAIKLVPIILALKESEFYRPIVISTGQHHRMVQEIFQLAGITTDVTLWAGTRRELNERVSSVMRRFEDFMVEWFGVPSGERTNEQILSGQVPAAVLVHGDTSSAMAAALASFHLQIPVMHVEAGLRTGGLNLTPFPEELNRRLISQIACLHFAPTMKNLANLVHERVPAGQVFVTGNTGIDALRWASGLNVEFEDPRLQALVDGDHRIVVVTAHRRENWGHGLDCIAEGVARLAGKHPEVRFVVPMHPNPAVREQIVARLRDVSNVLLTEPLGYARFARLLGRCDLVITDSGGIQEEAPSLGKPVLVTRQETERLEGVEEGTLLLVGTDPDRIASEGDRLLSDPEAYAQMAEADNPYGDGRAARRIVAALEYLLLGADAPRAFGPGYNRGAVIDAAGFAGPFEPVEAMLGQLAGRERRAEEQANADEQWLT